MQYGMIALPFVTLPCQSNTDYRRHSTFDSVVANPTTQKDMPSNLLGRYVWALTER